MKTIEEKIVIPKNDRITSISPDEAEFIYKFLKKQNFTRTLEVGFAYGYSTAYIMLATDSKHVAIDPYQKSYQNLGIKNIKALGFKSKFDLRTELSHVALPALLEEGKSFQFIFIDGGHKFDEIFIDWFYSDLLLESNGYILFHDSWLRSTQLVAEFIRKNRVDYREMHTPQSNFIFFKRISIKDNRPWYHFEEFYTLNSIKIYNKIKKGLIRKNESKS